MKQQMVTMAREQPEKFKKKAVIPDDTIVQLKLSLDAIRKGKVKKFNLKAL